MLKTISVVDSEPIDAPSSTKNKVGERDLKMHQVKKDNPWHFSMKAHIAVDADHRHRANVHDVTQATDLLHRQETTVWVDAGYRGIVKRLKTKDLAIH